MLCAIDAGGTKTEAILFSADGTVIDRILLGAANPNDVGIENAVEIISSAIDRLSSNAFLPVRCVFAGIAGCMTGDNAERMHLALCKRFPEISIRCAGDASNILALTGRTGNSMAVICGTGCAVFARNEGVIRIFGGWGQLFDDAGSAYGIGRDGIRLALSQHDGITERSLLSVILEKKLGTNVRAHLSEFYRLGKSYIASFSKLVFEAEAAGDRNAKAIIERNAQRVIELIGSAKQICGYEGEVIASGGLFSNESFARRVTDGCPNILISSIPQVYGAAIECMALAEEAVCEYFSDNFRKSYIRFTRAQI